MNGSRVIRPHSAETLGLFYGFLGVVCFSLTLPATRIAVADFDPSLVALGRAIIAALIAALALRVTRQVRPSTAQLKSLFVVGAGVVLGFPLLTSWAMRQLPASHGAIVIGLLPLATAIVGVVRAGERPSLGFWLAGLIGSLAVVVFAILSGDGRLQIGDLWLLGSVIAAGIGYAEGGKLARELGGWQVISWALVIAAPFLLIPFLLAVARHGLVASPMAWLGFGYVTVVSQFFGFMLWYRGLALGGIARVGQVQLLQPLLTLIISALFLGERITPLALLTVVIVVAAVAMGRRASIQRVPMPLLKSSQPDYSPK